MSAWRTIPRIVTSWYPWLSPGRHIDATHGHTIPSIHVACTFWISADCAEVENGWETLAVLQITSAALVPFKYGGTQTQHPWVVQKLLFEIFLAAHVFSHDAGLHLIISLLSPAVSRINQLLVSMCASIDHDWSTHTSSAAVWVKVAWAEGIPSALWICAVIFTTCSRCIGEKVIWPGLLRPSHQGQRQRSPGFPTCGALIAAYRKLLTLSPCPKKNTWSSSPSDCHPRFLPQYMLHCKAACGLVKGSWWNNTSTAVSCQEFASNLSWLRIKRLRHVAVNLYWHGDHSQLFANIQSS